jgi:hypothetical protein
MTVPDTPPVLGRADTGALEAALRMAARMAVTRRRAGLAP